MGGERIRVGCMRWGRPGGAEWLLIAGGNLLGSGNRYFAVEGHELSDG